MEAYSGRRHSTKETYVHVMQTQTGTYHYKADMLFIGQNVSMRKPYLHHQNRPEAYIIFSRLRL
jgi:hypothetical protein